jgi:hypothetical protein
MKSLIQKQNAKQVGTLYHYTNVNRLYVILQGDRLGVGNSGFGDYVSFTRDRNFHRVGRFINSNMECRIIVDGNNLSNNYKIEPFNYFNNKYEKEHKKPEWFESEERVAGAISPIKPYIIGIDILSEQINIQILNAKFKRIDLPFEFHDLQSIDDLVKLFQTLYSGPINVV